MELGNLQNSISQNEHVAIVYDMAWFRKREVVKKGGNYDYKSN